MRKLSLIVLSLGLAVSLAACGSEAEETTADGSMPDTENVEESASDEDEEAGATEEESQETEADNGWETQVGETVENEGGAFTLIARNDQVETQETGPMILNIPQVNAASAKLKGDVAEFLETEDIEYIQIDMEVENTSEDTITFYPAQATITTNTGEQLESDIWLSDHIDGDFFGQVKQEGSQYFILEKSKAEEIEWVRILISAPLDENWNSLGEDLDFRVELK
ncbi:hypothetical protein [Alkalihalobacterium chitinilyticum]|uniref:DUF4352 domain-containing protein n=1 Tax=Alkalihalobacterium chitinilyticum TaxID=2980103 RepID=A0ABT5VFI4_9BACI|nr:hypothetical protein [Alkalihalobacterium chitinilyticum]MDE5414214.1 DUF4352 domain-containing protein [Alkalihalobacterium chitinilyticum]